MGVSIKDIITTRERTDVGYFASKVVAIDAYNAIYQFLSSIRGADGAQMTDSSGRVTSHLSGLFNRNISFLVTGVKPVYVFDGKPPSLKFAEVERRRQVKRDAAVKYEKAVSRGDMAEARKYAQQTTSLQDGMIQESKHLLDLLGIPYVDAPSEGEAVAAHMASAGVAFASASQDFDSVLFGAKRLVRNFTSARRRKNPNSNTYVDVVPEIIEAQKVYDALGITHEQIVDIGILVGTDFNPRGFERIGPKTALKLIKKHKRLEDIPSIQEQLGRTKYGEIREIFLAPKVPDEYTLEFGAPDRDGIHEYLAGERDFSGERIQSSLHRLEKAQERRSQSLEKWF